MNSSKIQERRKCQADVDRQAKNLNLLGTTELLSPESYPDLARGDRTGHCTSLSTVATRHPDPAMSHFCPANFAYPGKDRVLKCAKSFESWIKIPWRPRSPAFSPGRFSAVQWPPSVSPVRSKSSPDYNKELHHQDRWRSP